MADEKTMTEKIGRAPDWVTEKFDDARRMLLHTYPKTRVGRMARGGGYFLLSLMRYMNQTFDIMVVNNAILRGMERGYKSLTAGGNNTQGRSEKFQAFLHKNPWILSYLSYYMMMAGVISGGGAMLDNARDDAPPKTKIENKIDDKKSSARETVDVAPVMATPANISLDAYWADAAIGLTELETYRATPRLHQGEERHTNGLGLTWTYIYDKNGKLHKKANDDKTRARDKDGNFEQVRRHLAAETIPALRRALKNLPNVTDRHAVALILAGYQRPADIAVIAAQINKAKNIQDVADAFTAGNIPQKWREGTLKRRWVCAAYAAGILGADDLLKMHRDVFSCVDINNIYRNGHFLLGAQTVQYVLGRTNKNSTVEKFLSGFDMGKSILDTARSHESRNVDASAVIAENTEIAGIEESMRILNAGEKLFAAGDYAGAVREFRRAIDQDPDNMGAYDDLAAAYNKMGEINSDVSFYQKAVDIVVECNRRMNANKGLLMDRDVKAETYYAAGCARRAVGDIYAASKKIKLAQENYEMARKNFENAVFNCKLGAGDAEKMDKYKRAINTMDKDTKKLGFAGGRDKLGTTMGIKTNMRGKHSGGNVA